MFSFSLLNHPERFSLDEDRIRTLFSHIADLHREDDERLHAQNGILHIAFLSDEEIQILNKTHRQKDSSTDVLSFHYFDDFSAVGDDEVAGEIILSESHILAQAEQYGHPPERECEILMIHSILHILGFDHETDEDFEEMWQYEYRVRSVMGLSLSR